MMQQLSYRLCPKCKWEGESAEVRCPRCHKKTMTRGFIRGTGAALTALGAVLVVFMGSITIAVMGIVQQGDKPGAAHFNGTRTELYVIFSAFGLIIFFGFVAIMAGLWQMILGRRNMTLIYLTLALGVLFFIGGNVILAIFDR
jgi:uncharacterized paraquat-inducible protein A